MHACTQTELFAPLELKILKFILIYFCLEVMQSTGRKLVTLYFCSTTTQRQILYILLHCIYLITLISLQIHINNTKHG